MENDLQDEIGKLVDKLASDLKTKLFRMVDRREKRLVKRVPTPRQAPPPAASPKNSKTSGDKTKPKKKKYDTESSDSD